MESNNLNRIRSVSAKFKLLFLALIFIQPLMDFIFWMSFNYLPEGFTTDQLPVPITSPLSLGTLWMAFLVSLVPTSVIIYGLLNLKTLFSLYEQGIVFTQGNVQCFHRLGLSLMALVIAGFIHTPLLSMVLSFNNPEGQRMLTLQFGTQNLSLFIMGAMLVLVSWVMSEAVKLEHEQAHTV